VLSLVEEKKNHGMNRTRREEAGFSYTMMLPWRSADKDIMLNLKKGMPLNRRQISLNRLYKLRQMHFNVKKVGINRQQSSSAR
jgi:hypothetical protein